MVAAARLASPLSANLIARSRSPQPWGEIRQSHITTGLSPPLFRSSFMEYAILFRQEIGLWLARTVLRLTGNRELACASRVLPLIPQRRLATSLEPLDPQMSKLL